MNGFLKIAPLKRIAYLCVLSASLAAVVGIAPARADEDPFQMDTSHWMSFDHYKDAVTRGVVTPQPSAAENAMPPEAAASPMLEAPTVTASTKPVIAAPTRPLDLPPMPGLNKGFQVHVTTTEDDNAPATAAPVIATEAGKTDVAADIHISDRNWQDPSSIARYKKSMQGDEDNVAPLDIRMSYLPDSKIAPTETPSRTTAHHAARLTLEKSMITKKPEKTPTEVAACAAIDAYKKQQLDAIQSDRQTLKALQDAIATLGLQKQLGFMTGSDSALNYSGATQVNVDIPASTSVR